ncbi:MAG: tRNA dihydrouridine synthase DusB [Deltaproteobacteria bacterium]|nr:tRNA dihydrouridine synthase DusB [Deltaproteobacteria bacterium]
MLHIGSLRLENHLIMAPMAGITNLPFRMMVKRYGAGLVFTEMVSAMGLSLNQQKTLAYLKSHPQEKPLAVQIFGNKPHVMAEAAKIAVDAGANMVDINMGCPVKKVVKTGAGASLLKNPRLVSEIVLAVRKACPIPLSVKIRSGWSPAAPNALDIAHIIEDCGADAVTLHARFASQGFSGQADWSWIKRVKQHVGIPVIGNGDILTPQNALDMKTETGCDGIMIGRSAANHPWIFRQVLQLEKGLPAPEPGLSERRSLILEHFNLLSRATGEKGAALTMRGFLLRYAKGLPNSSRFRGNIAQVKDLQSLMTLMDDYFHDPENEE